MTREEAIDAFIAVTDDLREVFLAKNADYATNADPWSNFRECERGGVAMQDGLFTRTSDKWARYCNVRKMLKEGRQPSVNEPLRETRRDLINYLIIADITDNGTD